MTVDDDANAIAREVPESGWCERKFAIAASRSRWRTA